MTDGMAPSKRHSTLVSLIFILNQNYNKILECDSPILLITRMITDRIGLHSVLLPLLIIRLSKTSVIKTVGAESKTDGKASLHFPPGFADIYSRTGTPISTNI